MTRDATHAVIEEEGNPPTLVDVVRRRARETPERIAYTFLRDGEEDEQTVRYAELDARARAIARALDATTPAAVAALLVFDPGPEFVAGFLGCLYAGVVAVPVYPPDSRDPASAGARIRRVADDAEAAVMLTTKNVGARLEEARLSGVTCLAVDALAPDSQSREWEVHRRSDVAFLQYTSGSTGTPRGVVVTHANLMAHGSMVAAVLGLDPDAVAVSWLPVHHDMGLIGTVLIPLQIGFRTVQMSPLHFLERPVRWLRAITRYRGTLSPAPNFAYDLVARKTTPEERRALALDCWRAAMNGAEPIRAATCDRFVATFASAGFRAEAFAPCYGLAEATLMVAGGPLRSGLVRRIVDGPALDAGQVVPAAATAPGARALIAAGAPLPGLTVSLADAETGAPVAEGRVGEIRVAGPTVAAGYWRRVADTGTAFASRADGTGRVLRTGDLGFLAGGVLYVTGRCKDLIVVRGRNHHPHDLEDTAAGAHPSLRPGGGAAFSEAGDDGERAVLVHETDADDPATLAAAADAVRAVVLRVHGLLLSAVVLIPPRTLPKTTSGKVRRHACRELLRAGRLPVCFERVTGTASDDAGVDAETHRIETALLEIVAGLRDLAPGAVGREAALAALGVDSAEAAEVAVELEARLGRRVPLQVLMEQPTIARVAAVLRGVAA